MDRLLALGGAGQSRGRGRQLLVSLFLLDFKVQLFQGLELYEKEVSDCLELTVDDVGQFIQRLPSGREVGLAQRVLFLRFDRLRQAFRYVFFRSLHMITSLPLPRPHPTLIASGDSVKMPVHFLASGLLARLTKLENSIRLSSRLITNEPQRNKLNYNRVYSH